MNVKKWKNNKFIENLKIKQYPAYPAEFIVFLCVTLFRQKMAEKRYTICILLLPSHSALPYNSHNDCVAFVEFV